MEAEAMPMIERLGLKKDDPPVIAPPAPCISYSGTDWGMKIHLVCFGKCPGTGMDTVGTAPASLFSYLAIQAFSPDVVVSAGTAGGFKCKGASIGDVFVATNTVNHDRRIPIPGFAEYGVDKRVTMSAPKLTAALNFKSGVCSSGNSLDYTKEDMELMMEHEACVKEMEAAAISWSASLFCCPVLCLKSITDIVDGDRPAQDEFLENLHKAAAALQEAVPRTLEFFGGKTLGDLY
jgi:5'-methylthioadenosine nucleosidase